MRNGPVGTLSLNRPEVHNALHIGMIRELTHGFQSLAGNPDIRLILLEANGENFCAGADLQWMKQGQEQSREQLEEESRELAGLFRLITEITPLVLAVVRGKVLGGANGLVAAADLVLAAQGSVFGFPEVKLGLVPATIAPFVVRKSGWAKSADWMLTGRVFPAEEAMESGLVQYLAGLEELEEKKAGLVKKLLTGGPEATRGVKRLLRELDPNADAVELERNTAAWIANFRTSKEGQEGMKAFFEKRKPDWYVD
jgi:methylglutaconyl-CoA hydratase